MRSCDLLLLGGPRQRAVGLVGQLLERTCDLVDRRPVPFRQRCQRVEVEVVELRRVLAEDATQLVLTEICEDLAEMLPGVRRRPFVVRVVAAPHVPVSPRGLARLDVERRGEARTDPTTL